MLCTTGDYVRVFGPASVEIRLAAVLSNNLFDLADVAVSSVTLRIPRHVTECSIAFSKRPQQQRGEICRKER